MLESKIAHHPKTFEKILAEIKEGKKKKVEEFRQEVVDKEQEVGENYDYEEESSMYGRHTGAEPHLSSQPRPIREHWAQKNADTHSQASVTLKESSIYGHTGADKTKGMREMYPNFPVLNTVQSQQGNLLFKCFYLSFKIRYWYRNI